MAELPLAPVAPRERSVTLDVLRGFALCGVLIGNMVLYSGRWAGRGARGTGTRLDEIASWFVELVVASKAQTMLTFLFGLGFAVQLVRAQERGRPVTGLYLRRMVVLLALGLAHVTLLWWGDVTWTYAVAGFGMLAFARASNRTRVIAGLALVFVPLLVVRVSPAAARATSELLLEPGGFMTGTRRMLDALHHGAHAELPYEHLRYAAVWITGIYAWYFFWTLGRFLLGYVAGARAWFEADGAAHLPVFRRVLVWGGAVATVSTAVAVLERLQYVDLWTTGAAGRAVGVVVHESGLLALTGVYAAVVVLLMQRPAWRRILAVIAPVGRMPLTTYFSQSAIATFLFYGWGLHWAGRVGPAGCLGLAIAIFAVQVGIAHAWLRYFQLGPLEWVWRSAVYLRPQPMRR